MTTQQIAVIGGGRWGQNIIRTLHQLKALAAIVETDEARRGELQSQYPETTLFANVDALLKTTSCPVAIATPVVTHHAVAKQVLDAGRDVFIEKPMAMTTEECDELNALAKQNDKIIMVGHLLIYQPAIQFIKEFLDAGKLGKVHSLRQVRRNLGTIRQHENALYSLGVHDLAVLDFLIGEPVKQTKGVGQSIITPGVEDDMSLHLVYANGIHAHLHVCWLWPYKERSLMVLGEKGALVFDELQQTVTWFHNYGKADATVHQGEEEIVFNNSGQPLVNEMQHFMHCIEHRLTPMSDGVQGREVVGVMANSCSNSTLVTS